MKRRLERLSLLIFAGFFGWLMLGFVTSYGSLPCGGRRAGLWKPAVNDYAGLRVSWLIDLKESYSVDDFLDCLRTAGYRVSTLNETSRPDAHLATRKARVIANGDGLGNTFDRRFVVWHL